MCVCKIEDGKVVSPCGAHLQWLYEAQERAVEKPDPLVEAVEINRRLAVAAEDSVRVNARLSTAFEKIADAVAAYVYARQHVTGAEFSNPRRG